MNVINGYALWTHPHHKGVANTLSWLFVRGQGNVRAPGRSDQDQTSTAPVWVKSEDIY